MASKCDSSCSSVSDKFKPTMENVPRISGDSKAKTAVAGTPRAPSEGKIPRTYSMSKTTRPPSSPKTSRTTSTLETTKIISFPEPPRTPSATDTSRSPSVQNTSVPPSDPETPRTTSVPVVPKINSIYETPKATSVPDISRPLPVPRQSPSLDESSPRMMKTVSEDLSNTSASRRGTKRNFGEVSESETSDLKNASKSSKPDLTGGCLNSCTSSQVLSSGENKIKSTDVRDETTNVRYETKHNSSLGASNNVDCTDTQTNKMINKSKPDRICNDTNDTNSTNKNITVNTFSNNFSNASSNSMPNKHSSSSKIPTSISDAKNKIGENSTKPSTLTTNTDDSSNTRNSRVCNDISNTSAVSNSSDTRSISSTRAAALTIVTSSHSCSRISPSSRDASDSNSIRIASDTNNNNRDAINNNSDDSCQSTESGRTPTLASGRKVYGLRPRSSVRRLWAKQRPTPEDESSSDPPSDSSVPSKLKLAGNKASHGASSKSKSSGSKTRGSRTKPLSKYRRITANARERERMKEINTAFAALRAALPTIADYRIASMTKYTTLQLASSYIRDLSKLLDETPSSDSENKKENCPSYLHGALTSSNRRDVNLSVGISELSFERNQQSGSEDKPGDFSVFPNTVNGMSNITEEQLEGLGDIENLSDMCWALDFMLE